MFVLGVNRAYLYAHPERELTAEEDARYEEVLAERSTGMPSADTSPDIRNSGALISSYHRRC